MPDNLYALMKSLKAFKVANDSLNPQEQQTAQPEETSPELMNQMLELQKQQNQQEALGSVQSQIDNTSQKLAQVGVDPVKATDTRNFVEKALGLRQNQNVVFDIMQVLGKPQQALFGAITEAAEGGNWLEGIGRGLSGKEEYTGGGMLRAISSGDSTETGAFDGTDVLGFALDIFADPADIAFLGAGSVAKVLGKADDLVDAGKAAMKGVLESEKIADMAKGASEALDAAKLAGESSETIANLTEATKKLGVAATRKGAGKVVVDTIKKSGDLVSQGLKKLPPGEAEKIMNRIGKSYEFVKEGEKYLSPTDLVMRGVFGTFKAGFGVTDELLEAATTAFGGGNQYKNIRDLLTRTFNPKNVANGVRNRVKDAFGREAVFLRYAREVLPVMKKEIDDFATLKGLDVDELEKNLSTYFVTRGSNYKRSIANVLSGDIVFPYSDEGYNLIKQAIDIPNDRKIEDVLRVFTNKKGQRFIDFSQVDKSWLTRDKSLLRKQIKVPSLLEPEMVETLKMLEKDPDFMELYKSFSTRWTEVLNKAPEYMDIAYRNEDGGYFRNTVTQSFVNRQVLENELFKNESVGMRSRDTFIGRKDEFAAKKYAASPYEANIWANANLQRDMSLRVEKQLKNLTQLKANDALVNESIKGASVGLGKGIGNDKSFREVMTATVNDATRANVELMNEAAKEELQMLDKSRKVTANKRVTVFSVKSADGSVTKVNAKLRDLLDPEDYNRFVDLKRTDPDLVKQVIGEDGFNQIGTSKIKIKEKVVKPVDVTADVKVKKEDLSASQQKNIDKKLEVQHTAVKNAYNDAKKVTGLDKKNEVSARMKAVLSNPSLANSPEELASLRRLDAAIKTREAAKVRLVNEAVAYKKGIVASETGDVQEGFDALATKKKARTEADDIRAKMQTERVEINKMDNTIPATRTGVNEALRRLEEEPGAYKPEVAIRLKAYGDLRDSAHKAEMLAKGKTAEQAQEAVTKSSGKGVTEADVAQGKANSVLKKMKSENGIKGGRKEVNDLVRKWQENPESIKDVGLRKNVEEYVKYRNEAQKLRREAGQGAGKAVSLNENGGYPLRTTRTKIEDYPEEVRKAYKGVADSEQALADKHGITLKELKDNTSKKTFDALEEGELKNDLRELRKQREIAQAAKKRIDDVDPYGDLFKGKKALARENVTNKLPEDKKQAFYVKSNSAKASRKNVIYATSGEIMDLEKKSNDLWVELRARLNTDLTFTGYSDAEKLDYIKSIILGKEGVEIPENLSAELHNKILEYREIKDTILPKLKSEAAINAENAPMLYDPKYVEEAKPKVAEAPKVEEVKKSVEVIRGEKKIAELTERQTQNDMDIIDHINKKYKTDYNPTEIERVIRDHTTEDGVLKEGVKKDKKLAELLRKADDYEKAIAREQYLVDNGVLDAKGIKQVAKVEDITPDEVAERMKTIETRKTTIDSDYASAKSKVDDVNKRIKKFTEDPNNEYMKMKGLELELDSIKKQMEEIADNANVANKAGTNLDKVGLQAQFKDGSFTVTKDPWNYRNDPKYPEMILENQAAMKFKELKALKAKTGMTTSVSFPQAREYENLLNEKNEAMNTLSRLGKEKKTLESITPEEISKLLQEERFPKEVVERKYVDKFYKKMGTPEQGGNLKRATREYLQSLSPEDLKKHIEKVNETGLKRDLYNSELNRMYEELELSHPRGAETSRSKWLQALNSRKGVDLSDDVVRKLEDIEKAQVERNRLQKVYDALTPAKPTYQQAAAENIAEKSQKELGSYAKARIGTSRQRIDNIRETMESYEKEIAKRLGNRAEFLEGSSSATGKAIRDNFIESSPYDIQTGKAPTARWTTTKQYLRSVKPDDFVDPTERKLVEQYQKLDAELDSLSKIRDADKVQMEKAGTITPREIEGFKEKPVLSATDETKETLKSIMPKFETQTISTKLPSDDPNMMRYVSIMDSDVARRYGEFETIGYNEALRITGNEEEALDMVKVFENHKMDRDALYIDTNADKFETIKPSKKVLEERQRKIAEGKAPYALQNANQQQMRKTFDSLFGNYAGKPGTSIYNAHRKKFYWIKKTTNNEMTWNEYIALAQRVQDNPTKIDDVVDEFIALKNKSAEEFETQYVYQIDRRLRNAEKYIDSLTQTWGKVNENWLVSSKAGAPVDFMRQVKGKNLDITMNPKGAAVDGVAKLAPHEAVFENMNTKFSSWVRKGGMSKSPNILSGKNYAKSYFKDLLEQSDKVGTKNGVFDTLNRLLDKGAMTRVEYEDFLDDMVEYEQEMRKIDPLFKPGWTDSRRELLNLNETRPSYVKRMEGKPKAPVTAQGVAPVAEEATAKGVNMAFKPTAAATEEAFDKQAFLSRFSRKEMKGKELLNNIPLQKLETEAEIESFKTLLVENGMKPEKVKNLNMKKVNDLYVDMQKRVYDQVKEKQTEAREFLETLSDMPVFEEGVMKNVADFMDTYARNARVAKTYEQVFSKQSLGDIDLHDENSLIRWLDPEEVKTKVSDDYEQVVKVPGQIPQGFVVVNNVNDMLYKMGQSNFLTKNKEVDKAIKLIRKQLEEAGEGNLIMERNIANLLTLDYSKKSHELLQLADKANNLFKRNKLLSPAFNLRNFIGVTSNMVLSGIPISQIPRRFAEANEVFTKGQDLFNAYARLGQKAFESQGLNTAENMKLMHNFETFVRGGFSVPKTLSQTLADGTLDDIGSAMQDVTGVIKPGEMAANAGNALGMIDKASLVNGWGNATVDAYGRMAVMLHALDPDEGMDYMRKIGVGNEIEAVRLSMFDPRDLSANEMDIIKKVIPFYTFSKMNLAYHMKNMPNNAVTYHRVAKAMDATWALAGIDKSQVPQYKREQMYIPLPGMTKDGKYFAIKANLPMADLGETLSNPLKRVASAVTPLIRAPFEIASGSTAFSGRPIENYRGERSTTMPFLTKKQEYMVGQTGVDVPMRSATGLGMALGGDVAGGLGQFTGMFAKGDATKEALSQKYEQLDLLNANVKSLKTQGVILPEITDKVRTQVQMTVNEDPKLKQINIALDRLMKFKSNQ